MFQRPASVSQATRSRGATIQELYLANKNAAGSAAVAGSFTDQRHFRGHGGRQRKPEQVRERAQARKPEQVRERHRHGNQGQAQAQVQGIGGRDARAGT